ncbi:chemotaxis protein CheW [Roseburia sp. AM51-8]|jgi:purine-binding chemotaxis protein CheW|uniref:Purine-binding chemotaxis protein CheW n=1 Tax=Roseburia lenta TaxID=2763061 RepID=A0ABR7GEQ3_9FIRM|nr:MULTISPECIES: chemotaxis protein CheW [Roseburia]MBC5685276.1 purine-binding chemotaxis protein CheW [Roseburia lenta]RHO32064.1 chemotaxis protein CheW [Roseburia sp. AM16-25]RHQ02382.1 chemotaxis protein CheW [Roseburia sp. AM51-8]
MKDENGLDVVEKETVQYIVVSIGNEQYGLDISYVDNIVRMCKITRVPKAPAHYIGVINLRGEIVPLMSLRRKMNLEDDVFTDITRIIILKTEEQGLVGIVVDEVKEVIALAEDEIDRNTQNSQSDKTQYINGIGKNGDELISILEISSILDEVDAS